MERPQIRLIEDQKVEINSVEVSGYEAEQLLRKYGYTEQTYSTFTQPATDNTVSDSGLTFEEMIAKEEEKIKAQQQIKKSQQEGPRPTTFDSSRGYDSQVKYDTDEESGFSFKVQIVSDMPIPKY